MGRYDVIYLLEHFDEQLANMINKILNMWQEHRRTSFHDSNLDFYLKYLDDSALFSLSVNIFEIKY